MTARASASIPCTWAWAAPSRDQKTLPTDAQGVIAAVERLDIDLGFSRFIGQESQPFPVRREDGVGFVERRLQEGNNIPVSSHIDGKNIRRKIVGNRRQG